MRWLRRALLALLVLVLLGGIGGILLVRRSFPVTEGALEVAGLERPVTVVRNESGIPHIAAATSHDLFLAQGYVHAQDRFWQMDTWRHIGGGRLSEMFGEGQVETDAFLRTLGFEQLAEQAYEESSPDMKAALEAYAEGVNAYLAERPGGSRLSLEYTVLGLQNSSYQPEPWEPVDSLTWAHVMAWDLRANVDEEIERALISGMVGVERTEQLYPPYPDEHPVIVSSGAPTARRAGVGYPHGATAALERTAANLSMVEASLGRALEGIGSNNWVVDGSRTASGMPLLANDPHLGIQMPSIWYQAALWCEQVTESCPYRVAGFTFPGAPGVVIGHNERIAWGVTNLGPDAMDLFIERTEGDRYEYEGEWVDFETRVETVEVAGGDDVEIEVRSSRHGPVISGVFGDLDDLESGGIELPDEYAVTLAWKALEPSTLFDALLAVNLAEDWDEFREAVANWDIAAQNLVYADVDGHIGYQATGDIPVRNSGDGRYPVPGWTSEFEWGDSIPFDQLPSLFDPPSGMIVTANQPLVDGGYDGFIGTDHSYGYRANRITELLEQGESLEPADMVGVQMDAFDGSAPEVVAAVLELDVQDPAVEEIQQVLSRWSEVSSPFQMDTVSSGAAAYGAVWKHLLDQTFDELGEDLAPGGNSRFFEVMRLLLADPNDAWWDDTSTTVTESAPQIVERAVRAAHEELMDLLGDTPDDWRWGDIHTARFENQTLGQSGIGPIEALFNRTAPAGVSGGSAIVNATGWLAPEGYQVVAVPSMRMVVDLADFSRSLTINTTGQSGHAFHPHYFDQADDWTDGRVRSFPFAPPSAGSTLELVPG